MTNFTIRKIPGRGVTHPQGFSAGAVAAGIKKDTGVMDLGLLYSEKICACAALFTRNLIKAAPLLLSMERVKSGKAQAIIVNSGCANACTGPEGDRDAHEMSRLAAHLLKIPEQMVLVASTGVIGQRLPVNKIAAAISNMNLTYDGGHKFSHSIVTTDTYTKEVALSISVGEMNFNIGGTAKGAGMIHPDMATMLCFITTDALIDVPVLHNYLKIAADQSFNMVTIDGDTSPNDMVIVFANGKAGKNKIVKNTVEGKAFGQALIEVCTHLAKEIARDGEGANRLIEIRIEGARNVSDARKAARTVASSNLVKTAVYGADPNWGRIVAALGRSGANFNPAEIDLYIGELCLLKSGRPQSFKRADAEAILKDKEVFVSINLNCGRGSATAWGCDLSEEYVTINSAYTT